MKTIDEIRAENAVIRIEKNIKLIKATGMKLAPLAETIGIPLNTLKKYSEGKRNMPLDVIRKLKELIKKISG